MQNTVGAQLTHMDEESWEGQDGGGKEKGAACIFFYEKPCDISVTTFTLSAHILPDKKLLPLGHSDIF